METEIVPLTEQIAALWNDAVLAGGWPIPRIDDHHFGDLYLDVTRTGWTTFGLAANTPTTPVTQDGYEITYRYTLENDRIAVSRILRTLRTWRVVDKELKEVQSEAERLIAGATELSDEQSAQWARVELPAALSTRIGAQSQQPLAVGAELDVSALRHHAENDDLPPTFQLELRQALAHPR